MIAVSPAEECVCLLSDPTRINGIKSEEMRASREGKALVERNDYEACKMEEVPNIPNYMVVLPKSKFNGIRAHYIIRTDPNLGIGWAALCHVPCGCASCKEQLVSPWVPLLTGQSSHDMHGTRGAVCGLALRVQMTGRSVVLFLSWTMRRREQESHLYVSSTHWRRGCL